MRQRGERERVEHEGEDREGGQGRVEEKRGSIQAERMNPQGRVTEHRACAFPQLLWVHKTVLTSNTHNCSLTNKLQSMSGP